MISLNLMNRTKPFDPDKKPCYGYTMLDADLELDRILTAMSRDDKVVYNVCRLALFTPLTDADELEFRRENLADARKNETAVRRLYDVTMSLEPIRKAGWQPHSSIAITMLYRQALEILEAYVEALNNLRITVNKDMSAYQSEGFRGLYRRIQAEVSDSFMSDLRKQIGELAGTDKTLIGAELGALLQGVNYTLLRPKGKNSWLSWRMAPTYNIKTNSGNVEINEELADIQNRRERVLRDTANSVCIAVKYLESFFDTLRQELAFYIGCLNLEEILTGIGMPVCTPELAPPDSRDRAFDELCDISLSLILKKKATGNKLSFKDKKIYLITGANQGGKSTFLRSIGQAQLMAQCGMPVAAKSALVPLRNGLFTHFKREEDRGMKSGKLDEELVRLSKAIDYINPNSMVLLNESFASTNEREGSEICRQVTLALSDSGVEVFSVSHLYVYAAAFEGVDGVQYLRAERKDDGSRTFRLEEGKPLETAFGGDLYEKIIGD